MEQFKDLEKRVDATLEDMIKAKGNQEEIETQYYLFCAEQYSITNKYIRETYGDNYANKSVDIEDVIYDKKDVEKICKYMIAYSKTKAQSDLNKARLVLETEGDHIHNHLQWEKLADGAYAIYVEGGGGCNRCLNGVIEIEDGVKLPPYHPGCLCHITDFYMEDKKNDIY